MAAPVLYWGRSETYTPRAEQVAAAAAVGVSLVEFLDHPDGLVVNGIDLRRDLAAAIRRSTLTRSFVPVAVMPAPCSAPASASPSS